MRSKVILSLDCLKSESKYAMLGGSEVEVGTIIASYDLMLA